MAARQPPGARAKNPLPVPRVSAFEGGAAASVTRSKQHKLLQTARLWLARHNGSFDTVDCRFDVVAFTGNEVEWIKDAFNDHS